MKKRNPSIAAFSLVEVTLALAVVVIALVALLGLLTVGITSTRASTAQTAATNILTAVAADLEATPNITPSYATHVAKGTLAQTSKIYGIAVPAGGSVASSTPQQKYIGENGQVVASASLALYQLNVWTHPSSTTQQETFARLLITWPPTANYTNAQGYVENIIAINRT